MHEPRGKYNVGMGYAVSELGGDHLVVQHDPALANPESFTFKAARPLGITVAQPPRSFSEEKMHHFYVLERWCSLEKVVGYCFFGPAPRSFILPEEVLSSVNLASGWDLTIEDLLQIGERATNMARVFNMRARLHTGGRHPARALLSAARERTAAWAKRCRGLSSSMPSACSTPSKAGTSKPAVPPAQGSSRSRSAGRRTCWKRNDPAPGWILFVLHPRSPALGRSGFEIAHARLVDVLAGLGIPNAEVGLIVVNGEMVDLQTAVVSPADIVRLIPPADGG